VVAMHTELASVTLQFCYVIDSPRQTYGQRWCDIRVIVLN
jgi:hypothetical protein